MTTCPTCTTLTRERDNARDLAAALEEELAQSDVRASRAPEVAQHTRASQSYRRDLATPRH